MISRLLAAILWHVFKVITFNSDGTGLPRKMNGVFYLLLAITTGFAVIRHGLVAETVPVIGVIGGFLIQILVLAASIGASRFPLVGIYLCASSGADAIWLLCHCSDIPTNIWLPLWEISAFLVGVMAWHKKTSTTQ